MRFACQVVQTVQTHGVLMRSCYDLQVLLYGEHWASKQCFVAMYWFHFVNVVQRVAGNARRVCEWVVGNTSCQTSYIECSQLRLHQVCDGMKVQTFECLDLHSHFVISVIHLEAPWKVTTDLLLQYWHRQADILTPSKPQLCMANKCMKCIMNAQ
jgi:hypothetical protein